MSQALHIQKISTHEGTWEIVESGSHFEAFLLGTDTSVRGATLRDVTGKVEWHELEVAVTERRTLGT